jgi:hypothetical protein
MRSDPRTVADCIDRNQTVENVRILIGDAARTSRPDTAAKLTHGPDATVSTARRGLSIIFSNRSRHNSAVPAAICKALA